MSGIEVAGLVLGAIPLVLFALQSYGEGVSTVKRYFMYKRELGSLHRMLSTEYNVFLNTCEKLMDDVARPDQIALLLANPGGHLWKDRELERRLEKRLDSSYQGYLSTVASISAAIVEFKRRLGFGQDGKIQIAHPSLFKQEYKKLKFSLTRSSYEDLLASISRDNRTLETLTKQSIDLEPVRARRRSYGPNLKAIQDFANSVYKTLRPGLICTCHAPHTVNLRLEPRSDPVSSKYSHDEQEIMPCFHVVLSYQPKPAMITTAPWQWAEARIQLLKNPDPMPQIQPSKASPSPLPAAGKGVRFSLRPHPKMTQPINTTDLPASTNVPSIPLQTPQQDLAAIQDLCHEITTHALTTQTQIQQSTTCLGFLIDSTTNIRHGIYPLKITPPNSDPWSVISLDTILTQSLHVHRALSHLDKLRLSVILASSVLQLNQTPWLDEKWGKDDIFFLTTPNGTPIYGQPFVTRDLAADAAAAATNTTSSTATGLTGTPSVLQTPPEPKGLSICILNKPLFALGILLIELTYSKPIKQLRRDHNIVALPAGFPGADLVNDMTTALELLPAVPDEMGGRYGDAVAKCIRCNFDTKSTSLADERFRELVYADVVALLEDDLRQFQGFD